MAVDVYMKVVPGGLMCSNAAEASKLEDLVGREVRAVISQPRNIRFHKLYFALLKTALEMVPEDWNIEQFRLIVQTGAGWADYIEFSGKLIAVPRSISFAKMDELEFLSLYNAVLNYICERWALDGEQLDQMVQFM